MPLRSAAPSRRGLISAFAVVYLVWGSTYLAIVFAIESMPPLIMIGSRFLVAGLLVYAWMSLRGKAQPTRRMWRNAAVVGTLTLGTGTGAVAWAEQWLTSGVAALLVTSVPLWMVLLQWKWKGGPRPNRFVVAGLMLGLVGIVLLVNPAQLVQSTSGVIASLAVLVGTFSWSFGAIMGRDAELPEHPLMSTATQMISGGSALIVAGLLLGEAAALNVAGITSTSWLAWSYLVVFGSIVAFSSFVWLMKNAPAGQVATYAYVNPIVAVFLGWILADEYVGGRVLLAVVVLVTAVVLITRYGKGDVTRRQRRPKSSLFLEEMAHSLDGPTNTAPLRLFSRERTTALADS